MEKKLQTKNLTISFRTDNGKVQAVRGINFDLYKGETLAIVGESGSGKSVTSKAIIGILAGNSIVESGEIIYDGQDLLKINEEDFHKIRGDKIAMIFQDPLSSLNPIVKIGKQITEAMLLKNKTLYALRKDFKLEEGEFFLADMIGLEVIDADDGRVYGKLREIMNRGASDIYVVDTPHGERMIPAVDEFIISIDIEKGIFVRPIEGMLD